MSGREFQFLAGSGAGVVVANNADGTQTITITASGSVSAPTGTGWWWSNAGSLLANALVPGLDISNGGVVGSTLNLEVSGILAHSLPALSAGYLNWNGSAWVFTTPVTSATAGTGISVSGSTGAVTFSLVVPVTVADGGTGLTAVTAHSVPVGNGTSALNLVTGAASGRVLTWHAGADPSFDVVDLSGSGTALSGALGAVNGGTSQTSLPLLVTNGGTNRTSLTGHSVLIGNSTAQVNFASPSTAGFALVDNGTGLDPSFKPVVQTFASSANGVAITGTETSVASVSVTVDGTQWVSVWASLTFSTSQTAGQTYSYTIRSDGVTQGSGRALSQANPSSISPFAGSINRRFQPAAGTHTIAVYAAGTAGGTDTVSPDLLVIVSTL